ncbi:MCE family protein [Mycolicibacterium pulveris]|uniref:Virulence factor n=1 Tax=Mycolicibacterium pulveris TaxID=36813 RepID=A0A7I7UH15_MYCPV|nr:MCE family protein [Mycolicibacterium pulveris]MCV6978626.1 MCE family protein [Mycolicibacterium pulveris]BBY80183.1 virulence factor [Mycolicibacterium pulveris]
MFDDRMDMRIKPAWWTAILLALIVGLVLMTAALFTGTFRKFVPVTLTSDRSGLILESGGKVKLRGVQVGRIASVTGTGRDVVVRLNMFPDAVSAIPANVGAQIMATTAFGAKYVDLIYPEDPSPQRLKAGTVLTSRNVSSEVNTVFENLYELTTKLDPVKLNATLTALADGVRGQGERIGQATTDANQVLLALNPRMDTVAADWRSLKGFSDAYAAAAPDIMEILDGASETGKTITDHAEQLNTVLLNSIGFAQSGANVLGRNANDLVHLMRTVAPTTDLLHKYDATYTCTLQGAVWFLNNGGRDAMGGNGRSVILDAALIPGDDPYKYPTHLPVVAAKGGPGGRPGCGSLPDPSKKFPVRQLVTNTGWGTGLDWRPNPGIGHPWLVNWFPVTKAVPEPPRVHGDGPPAIGPVPYPGAPPYGAPLYGPDGTPLYPSAP